MSQPSTPTNAHRKTWAILALATLVVRLPGYFLPMNRDAGMFAYGGWRILHGELPYLHFWDNKLPGIFYINALAIKLFGPTFGGLVTFQLIYSIFAAVAFYCVARKLSSHRSAFICSLLFIFYQGSYGLNGEGNFTESYTALPVLLAVLAIMHWSSERKGYNLLIVAGALGAVAGLIKQPAASVIPAMMVFIVAIDRRKSGWLAAGSVALGALLVAVITVVWLASKGILAGAMDANLTFNRLYFQDAYTYGLPTAMWDLKRALILTALPLAGAIAGIICVRRRILTVKTAAWLLVPWFVLDLVGVAMGGRFYDHYFLTMIPSALLLTGVFIDSLSSRKAMLAAIAAGVFLSFGPIWSYNGSEAINEAAPIGSIVQREAYVLNRIYIRRFVLRQLVESEEIALWLRQRTEETDTIFVWGYDPRIGFLSQRAFPTRYVHMHPLGASDFNRDARISEVAHALETKRPKFIVDESNQLPSTACPLTGPAPKSTCPFFRLDGYEPVKRIVAKHYKPVAVVAGCTIYGLVE